MFAGGGIPYGLMRGMGGGGHRRGGADPWFLMLAYQLWQQIERLGPNKPKLTLGLMALCAAMHFEVLGSLSPLALLGVRSARDACLSPRKAIRLLRGGKSASTSLFDVGHLLRRRTSWFDGRSSMGEFSRRVFLSPFAFADDVHLVVNLSSFLLQGARLEPRMGVGGFARFLLCIVLAVQVAHVFVAEALRRAGLIDVTSACLGGASAMNFALKAYLSVIEPNTFVTMWGFVIPGKFAACAELLIIHLLNPHAPSLVYHAVGLAVGVLFARARFGGMAEKLIRRLKKVSGSLLERARAARHRGPGRPDPPPGVREARAAAAAAAQARATTFPGRVFAGLRRRRNADKSANDKSANASSSVSLPPGTRVVLAGLRAADMNGSWGVVKGPDVAAVGRVRVALDSGSEFSVLPEKCVVVDAAG
jgi:membrane associated rhomboid family serine protease